MSFRIASAVANGGLPVRWQAMHPRLEELRAALARGEAGFGVVCSAALRTDEDQATLYAWGRTVRNPWHTGAGLGPVVTNAKTASESNHGMRDGYAWAMDVHPEGARTPERYRAIHAVAARYGCRGGGFYVGGGEDMPHVEALSAVQRVARGVSGAVIGAVLVGLAMGGSKWR